MKISSSRSGSAGIMPRILMTACLSLASSVALAGALVSPWDVAPGPMQSVKDSSCPAAPMVSADLHTTGGIYADAKGSVHDERKMAALDSQVGSAKQAGETLVTLSNVYVRSGNKSYASCADAWLVSLARTNALGGNMDGFQAHFTQAWMLSTYSLVWLKVRTDPDISQADRALIGHWLDGLARETIEYFDTDRQRVANTTNLTYWAGLAVMSTGVALNRQDYFQWGVDSFKKGAQQITPEGYMPAEVKRGARALPYHLFSIQPLVMMAELAAANGVNLYAYNNYALTKLIYFTLHNVDNPNRLTQLAGASQVDSNAEKPNLGWLAPFSKRYPDPYLDGMLRKFPNQSYTYLGGMPPPAVNLAIGSARQRN